MDLQELIIVRATPNPLTINVRDLEHRPGTMRTWQETVPAPSDFGNALIGAPEGSDMVCDLRLESVHDGILVSGDVTVSLEGQCSRCLDPITDQLVVEVQELFLFDAASEDSGDDDEADEMYEVQDESIDLEPMLRDAAITRLPFQPVCGESCEGLCAQCGVRLDENPGHQHEVRDPRWSALEGLFDEDPDTTREER